jgi:choice-of-anchor B domain-containing protein
VHDRLRRFAPLKLLGLGLSLAASFALLSCGAGSGAGGGVTTTSTANPPEPEPGRLNMLLRYHLDLDALIGTAGNASLPHEVSAFHDGEPLEIEGANSGSGNWGYTSPTGRRFALTGTSAGLSIVEVTNPRSPRNIALIPGPASSWREVKTYREYAYVTTEAVRGLDIVSMANPDAPVLVGTFNATFNRAHTVTIDQARGLAFVNGTRRDSTETGMRVLSLADPAHPVEVGSFPGAVSGGFYIHDGYVRGSVYFASSIYEGFEALLDITNPAAITEITRFTTGGQFTHNSWLNGEGSVLFTTDERNDRPLEGWDITNPFAPRKVSQFIARAGTIPHNVMVDGNRLLVSHYTEGVRLLDITNAKAPKEIGYYDTYSGTSTGFNGCWGAYIFPGSNLIVASDINSGLWVLEYQP